MSKLTLQGSGTDQKRGKTALLGSLPDTNFVKSFQEENILNAL